MQKFLLTFLSLLLVVALSSCQSTKESEKAKAERLARREAHDQRRQRAQVSNLPGLNEVEMNAIQETQSTYKIEDPNKFIFSRNPQEPNRAYLNDLNDEDKARMQNYKKSSEQSDKASSEWIYGF